VRSRDAAVAARDARADRKIRVGSGRLRHYDVRIMKASNDSFVDSRDFARIAKAIRYIDGHFREQPRLTAIASHAGLSEFHFNRLFRRWAGVTPKQYLAFVTGQEARGAIARQPSVLDAAYSVGLSGPGRLHDLIVTLDAVTPGELKALGSGITIHYGLTPTPFGDALLASTPRGLCHLAFVDSREREKALEELRGRWRNAELVRDDARAREFANRIWNFKGGDGGQPGKPMGQPGRPMGQPGRPMGQLNLHVAGTNFQLKVWQALLDIGVRGHTTYSALAEAIGAEGSARAVSNAVGANPVGWLIPCHNVLRRDGSLGGYHWGEDRKRAILAWDSLASQREKGRSESAVPLQATQ
jgi:AraC family transcriptional regulator, regulatory protein of adaptative response / methylated-DNA-[protein]-cysteine methyltransferase